MKTLIDYCRAGNLDKVKQLAQGVNLNNTATCQYPASVQHPKGLEVAGTTPLLEALSHNHVSLAEWLIENGADIHHTTPDGWNAAHLAGYMGSADALAFLTLAKNFSFYTKDKKGFNVLDAIKATPNRKHLRLMLDLIPFLDSYKSREDGLCRLIEKEGLENCRLLNETHLQLVKYLVEFAGHTEIKGVICLGMGRSRFNEQSAYEVAQTLGYQYLVSYFDEYEKCRLFQSKKDMEFKLFQLFRLGDQATVEDRELIDRITEKLSGIPEGTLKNVQLDCKTIIQLTQNISNLCEENSALKYELNQLKVKLEESKDAIQESSFKPAFFSK